jgi:hypothetical protein
MATYKVIQDIEAEDKIVGPLTLRQLIYAGVAALCGYLCFISFAKHVTFLLPIFGPIMLFFAFFAFPWGRDQPTEIWALAKIRFLIKPRRRIWDQTGASDLVHITAPKRIEKIYTNQLSETEVNSRLSALANTLDSRGWAVKNVNMNTPDPTAAVILPPSDRLLDPSSLPQTVSDLDITAGDDMLDEVNNSRAQQLDEMVNASSSSRRQQWIDQLSQPEEAKPIKPVKPIKQLDHHAKKHGKKKDEDEPQQLPPPADYWFLRKPLDIPDVPMSGGPSGATTQPPSNDDDGYQGPVAANPTPDEAALAEELKANREKALQTPYYQHMKIIQPLAVQAAEAKKKAAKHPPVAPPPDPAIIGLANDNDHTVATIARIASRQDEQPDEIVIPLHHRHSS